MGTIVAGSAINKGLELDGLALMHGSIPAQCFDPSNSLRQAPLGQVFTREVAGIYLSINYTAWAGGDLCDDSLPGIRALAYRDRASPIIGNPNIINCYLVNDTATKDAWEANQWAGPDPLLNLKPMSGYDYDVGVSIVYETDEPAVYYSVTRPEEAMAMVNQSITKAIGTESRTGGGVNRKINLDTPAMGIPFGIEHQAEFAWGIHSTWGFYGALMLELGYNPTP